LRSDGSRSSSFEFSEPSDARLGSNSTSLSVRSSPLQLQPWGFRRGVRSGRSALQSLPKGSVLLLCT
jgi:hypothetical protein